MHANMHACNVCVCRMIGNVSTPTTRQIRFNLDHLVVNGTYTLRIALAAAQMSRLTVHTFFL
jgi:rhamnogalacturonan endolyase